VGLLCTYIIPITLLIKQAVNFTISILSYKMLLLNPSNFFKVDFAGLIVNWSGTEFNSINVRQSNRPSTKAKLSWNFIQIK